MPYNGKVKLSVVIPVYNEKDTIEEIIKRVRDVDNIDKEIVLVDDASSDGTTDILHELHTKHPEFKMVFKEKNQGKGAALRDGFKATTGDYVIVQDADLEYDPQDYNKLIRALSENQAEVVYGSRFSGNYEKMSTLHYWGNKVLTLITNIFYHVMLTDMETCYKLLPGDFVRSLSIKSNRFNFEPEITAKILKAKKKIVEVPINYSGRKFSEGKKITWKDGFAAVWTLVKYRFTD
jgi:glycosyltransferase involved in cell wall biosynthesis